MIAKLSPREQRLAMALGVVAGAMLLLALPIYFYLELSEAREQNQQIVAVLGRMDKASEVLAKRRAQREALELRYAKKAPALASFIESAAKAHGLEVPESTDQPNAQGAGFTERITLVKMRQVNLKPLVLMLQQLERSGYPLAVTRFRLTKRAAGPDLWDVQLAVSAYDKAAGPQPKDGKSGKNGKNGPKRPKGTEL